VSISDPGPLEGVAALAGLGVATIHEALNRTGLLHHRIRPVADGTRVAGPAVTVRLPPGDNLGLHQSVELCGAGDVLVVATDGECTDGVFGELLAVSLLARGVRGVVLDAGCRDVARLRQMDLAVFSRAISAQGVEKLVPVEVNIPVVCAGARVHPGDVVVGDDDGVVIVPVERLEEVVNAGRVREELEAAGRTELERGVLTLDLLGLRGLSTGDR
jgi:4-hydroxy-4-methyl-2-oxoglutarate aldolase